MTFKPWKEQNHMEWRYGGELPPGQQWGTSEGKFITNRRGEGFHIHEGTRYEDKSKIIDALNKRDAEIEKLQKVIKDAFKGQK